MEFELIDDTAMLRFDDGKVNAIGHDFIDAINEGLDRAESEAKAVIILGRKDRFSAGLDLDEFKKGAQATQKLLKRGTEMFLRLYSHGQPIIAGCTGHAIADIANYSWIRSHRWARVSVDELEHLQRWMANMQAKPGIQRGCDVPPSPGKAELVIKGGAAITTT